MKIQEFGQKTLETFKNNKIATALVGGVLITAIAITVLALLHSSLLPKAYDDASWGFNQKVPLGDAGLGIGTVIILGGLSIFYVRKRAKEVNDQTHVSKADASQKANEPFSFHKAAADGKIDEIKKEIGSKSKDTEKSVLSYLLELDENNDMPIHKAVLNDHLDVVKLLLDNGVDPDLTGKNGDTPLHIAAQMGYATIVTHLLLINANTKIKNDSDKTPFDLAYKEFTRYAEASANDPVANALQLTFKGICEQLEGAESSKS